MTQIDFDMVRLDYRQNLKNMENNKDKLPDNSLSAMKEEIDLFDSVIAQNPNPTAFQIWTVRMLRRFGARIRMMESGA